MTIGNPTMRHWVKKSNDGFLMSQNATATYKGVYSKAALFALATILSAVAVEAFFWWSIVNSRFEVLVPIITGLVFASIALVVIALIVTFVPSTVKVLGFVYTILQGAELGLLTALVDALVIPGLSLAALVATAAVFFIALAVNRFTQFRISSVFVRGLLTVVISLVLVEVVMALASLFLPVDFAAFWWIQLIISAVCIIWATIMIFWDLQNIDYIVQRGADKTYEWNVSFALVTTLIYLYIEILELLVRLAALFSKNS